MNVDILLKRAKITCNDIEPFKKSLEDIIELLSSLPEPQDKDFSKLVKYSTLQKDEYDKKAQKSDIIENGDFYKI